MSYSKKVQSIEEFNLLLSEVSKDEDTSIEIDSIEFNYFEIGNQELNYISFFNCRFRNVQFGQLVLTYCTLESCEFDNCAFGDVDFHVGTFLQNTFVGSNHNIPFSNTNFFGCIFDENIFDQINFIDCIFMKCVPFDKSEALKFIGGSFSNCVFSICPLIDLIKFDSCRFTLCTFTFSVLSSKTFTNIPVNTSQTYNSIDLHTITLSEKLSPYILLNVFGIREPDIKAHIFGMVNEISLQSVFISYSFKDAEFARRLNDYLIQRGALTFLWEKDAPGGYFLKEIMRSNVQKFDRILFIASENSLKSEACQFELSQGRIKQEKDWKAILFPIHIDNFLFQVQKDQIRPLSKQDEYWQNIQELRTLNSLNFSDYCTSNFDKGKFEKEVEKLIQGLRKKK